MFRNCSQGRRPKVSTYRQGSSSFAGIDGIGYAVRSQETTVEAVRVSVTNLKLIIETPDGRKARIAASGSVDGVAKTITLAHGFGNRGAAVSYLRQNEPMLLDRARNWLFDPSIRPDSETTRRLLREELTARFGPKLVRLVLTGSRARGNSRPELDWDIVAVVEGTRLHGPEGPVAQPLQAPDGNPVDLIVIAPADFNHPVRFMAEMRANHLEL